MRKRTPHPITLTLSIVALGLSLYGVYLGDGFNLVEPTEEKVEVAYDQEFSNQVYDVIENYIAETMGQPAPNPTPVEVSIDDDPFKGDPNAPVTIIEFSDYDCPFCGKFYRESLPQITQEYIDTGKVKYVFRDFPLPSHPQAGPASNAANCLRDQTDDENYFAYHDLLFDNQGNLSTDKFKELAQGFDIDQDEFATCVDQQQFIDEVNADLADGSAAGVRGTPAFFINGTIVSGAQPFAAFRQVIEAELAKQ